MTAVDSTSKCACCAPSDAAAIVGGAEPTLRTRVLLAAGRLDIEGPDLDGLMAVFGQGACGATREWLVTLVNIRLAEAQRMVVELVERRRPAAGGVALHYEHDATVAVELARLATAEFACCSFFEFSLTVGPQGMVFTVAAPDEARDVVMAVFGAAEPVAAGDR